MKIWLITTFRPKNFEKRENHLQNYLSMYDMFPTGNPDYCSVLDGKSLINKTVVRNISNLGCVNDLIYLDCEFGYSSSVPNMALLCGLDTEWMKVPDNFSCGCMLTEFPFLSLNFINVSSSRYKINVYVI